MHREEERSTCTVTGCLPPWARILRHAALRKAFYIVALDKVDPLIEGPHSAMRELEHLRVGLEGNTL
jgi:hypothetical protein